MTPDQKRLRMQIASHLSWAATPDRSQRTAPARRAQEERFIKLAREQHPNATEDQIAKVAESLRTAHFKEMARRSAATRRAKKTLREKALDKRRAAFIDHAA